MRGEYWGARNFTMIKTRRIMPSRDRLSKIKGSSSVMRPRHDTIGSHTAAEGCVMNALRGQRDPRTGRVFGFQSEEQRQNFMIGRARFCNGLNRKMPRCTALNRLGEPCKAARMRGRPTCFRHGGTPSVKRDRLATAQLSGDVEARRDASRTQSAPRSLAA